MKKEAMPDWMMRYVANIGTNESYDDFRNLSDEYHSNRISQISVDSPAPNFTPDPFKKVTNTQRIDIAPNDWRNFETNEEYKKEALKLAEKHGYEKPAKNEIFNEKSGNILSDFRQNFNDLNGLSPQDLIAERAHNNFEKKNPDKAANYKDNFEKFKERELKEIDPKAYNRKYADKIFDETQDRFEATRLSEKERHEKRDDPSLGDAKYTMSSKFFMSLDMSNEKLQSIKDQYNKSASQQKDEMSQDKGDDKTETQNPDKPKAADKYFSDLGFNKAVLDTEKTTPNKTSVNFNYSASKGSDHAPSVAPDIDKD